MQQGCDGQLPIGGRSSQAVPVLNAEDSDDDVPPGFEADDVPRGFEQYSRACLREPSSSTSGTAAPAAGVADAPPGFEGRALRVQTVLARALQGTPSSQLQPPGTFMSGHSLPADQPSLHANAFERYQERVGQPQRAPAEMPAHAEECFSTAGPAAEHVQYSPASAGYRPSRLGAAGSAEFPGTPSWQRSAASSGGAHAGSPFHSSSTGAQVAAQVLQPRAAARSDSAQRRRYLFVAGPVCRDCGATGHEAAGCNTPSCEDCDLVSPVAGPGCCVCADRHLKAVQLASVRYRRVHWARVHSWQAGLWLVPWWVKGFQHCALLCVAAARAPHRLLRRRLQHMWLAARPAAA